MKKLQSYLLLFIFFAALIPAALPPDTVNAQELTEAIITPDGAGGYDTYISSTNPYTNYGSETTMLIGETSGNEIGRGLMNFDLSALPLDAEVVSATLTLTVSEDLAANASTLEMYPVLAPWVEAGAWWLRYRECTPSCWWTTPQWSDAWQVAGASGATDRTDELVGSVALASDLTQGAKITISISPLFAGNLMRANYQGFILQTSSETNDAYKFFTSDALDEANRPTLTISYDPSPDITDPGWFCVDGIIDCEPYMDPAISSAPFQVGTADSPTPNSYGGAPWEGYDTAIAVGGRIDCEPYPQCRNDYPIYYRISYSYEWTSQSQETVWATTTLRVSGGIGTVIETDTPICYADQGSNNTIGHCKGIMVGVIYPEQIPDVGSGTMDVFVKTQIVFSTGYPVSSGMMLDIYLSRVAPVESCSDTYIVPVPKTYEIDPTIETPVGMVGQETPTDEQGWPLTLDAMHMLKVEGGPWNDGTIDRTDTAISFDGTTYMTLQEFVFSEDVLCYDVSQVDPNLITVYFTAPTSTIYIRVNDTPGQTPSAFANNTIPVVESPLTYTIGIAFLNHLADACDAQFFYSKDDDIINQTVVHGNDDDQPVDHAFVAPATGLEPGAWYAIEVASGSWRDGTGAPRTDIEFKFTSTNAFADSGDVSEWEDLADGSDLVYCVSTDGKTVFVQSPPVENIVLHFRVNDPDNPINFTDNTGSVIVRIYNVVYTQLITGCGAHYQIGHLVSSGEVAANATGGMGFANAYGTGNSLLSSYTLTPGGWYALETKGGPWGQPDNFVNSGEPDYPAGGTYFDVTLKTEYLSGTTQEDWAAPADWPPVDCVMETDALGHVRVFFRIPDLHTDGVEYMIRVAGARMMQEGSIGWDLYEAIDISPGADGNASTTQCADYSFGVEPVGIGSINSTLEQGDFIDGVESGFYAVHIESANTAVDPPYYHDSGWYEGTFEDEGNTTEYDELELSTDNGEVWEDLPEHPDVLCYYYDEDEELTYIVNAQFLTQKFLMRANSTTFGNNIGSEDYTVYQGNEGTDLDPWSTCMDEYTASVPALNEHEWIPVWDKEGVNLMPTLTYVASEDDGPTFWNWGLGGSNTWNSPGLSSGHYYQVTTLDGPWENGEDPTSRYDAQLSSDGGETWYLFDEHPDVMCAVQDQLGWYWSAMFYAEPGQLWKIRVNDTDDAEDDFFRNNTGSLAYKINLLNEFIDGEGPGDYAEEYDEVGFDVCVQALVKPKALAMNELGMLGAYLGEWTLYLNRSVISYFAWCPKHTDMLMSAIETLKTREPLATLAEMDIISKTVVADVASYEWEGGYEDTSIFSVSGGSGVDELFDHVLPSNGVGFDIWDGGEIVVFGDAGLPSYYYDCQNVFANRLPSGLRTGTCFASAYWKETGASFWVQLALDIGCIFLLWNTIKGALQSLIYMMTGVRPWTKDGIGKIIIETARGTTARR